MEHLHLEQIRPELTWRLRKQVLYPGKPLFEMEMPEDETGLHFGAFYRDELVGVISLFNLGSGFQFRKFAVATALQGMGIGTALLQYISNIALASGGTRLWCNARVQAAGFYTRAGFNATGQAFTKNGIAYEIMEKPLI